MIPPPHPPRPLRPPSIAARPLHQLADAEGVLLSVYHHVGVRTTHVIVSTAPTAAPAASTPFIAYELRDASNGYASLASALVQMDATLPIDKLREAVFAANDKKLSDRNYTDLDVYPPGSSDVDLSVHSAARDPEDPISSVLPAAEEKDRKKRRVIIVARPLTAAAGVQGEQHRSREQGACWSALHPSRPPCSRQCWPSLSRSAVLSLSLSLSLSLTVNGCLRDLTRECVEANPGPVYCTEEKCQCKASYEELMKNAQLEHAKDKCPSCDHLIRNHSEAAAASSATTGDPDTNMLTTQQRGRS